MPSTNQPASTTRSYDSEPTKMLATKSDMLIAALIRGIRDPDRAQAYVEAELALAESDGRDPRKDIIGACNRRKRALTTSDGDADQ